MKEKEELIFMFMFCDNWRKDNLHLWPDGSNVPQNWFGFNFT